MTFTVSKHKERSETSEAYCARMSSLRHLTTTRREVRGSHRQHVDHGRDEQQEATQENCGDREMVPHFPRSAYTAH